MPKTVKNNKKYIDTDSEDDSVSDNESSIESGNESENQQPEIKVLTIKKKIQKSYIDYNEERIVLIKERNDEQTILFELIKKCMQQNMTIKKLNNKINMIDNSLVKSHKKEVKVASKEKRKRITPNTGGFNKETEIPKILRSYIGKEILPDNILKLARHKVLHLLTLALKRDKLKDGKITTINKKAAKKLGVKNGMIIQFEEHQTFLASFYKKKDTTNKTAVIAIDSA